MNLPNLNNIDTITNAYKMLAGINLFVFANLQKNYRYNNFSK
ncbi:hypothetical protein CSG_12460 [Campylobacter fetus subsp. venerealis str. 84-112]|uniref:Uncharacterized protein n=1 Tax=Campylobacter fetus subsp. fetus (strain 82-40) TaxID=360106 RepID=A0RNY8_CAMFF|nr:hypothetical protein CFF8240_0746 [Campylobacter fetus subsp. fetus 82-40]CDF65157.1 hypothetical protein CSG_12460 [Campylobacter fetus subsp. venerealis str. 84-112]